jgi:hypothetical protein
VLKDRKDEGEEEERLNECMHAITQQKEKSIKQSDSDRLITITAQKRQLPKYLPLLISAKSKGGALHPSWETRATQEESSFDLPLRLSTGKLFWWDGAVAED